MANDDEERRFLRIPIWKWDGLSGLISVVGLVAIVVAGLVAVWELRENQHAARVEATLDLLDVWENGKYLAAFRRLNIEVSAQLEKVPLEDLEAARANPLILERLYERISGEVLSTPKAAEDFENLVYFFQRLSICVEEALCAREPTLAFFRGPMKSFARTFDAEISLRRQTSPGFADGLDLVD